MKLFRHESRQASERSKRLYARYELMHTLADFGAALSFVVGSVLFFFDGWRHVGTWLFLIGSVLFAVKPSLRLLRELRLYHMNDFDDLAKREENR